MPWAMLLDLRVLLGIALIATGIYAKVQSVRVDEIKAEYAQFKADVESEAAKAKVAAAQEAARHAQNAQEAVDALQTRYDALNARYRVLRSSAGSGPVPTPSSIPTAISVNDLQPDPALGLVPEWRCLAAIEAGDREIAKYIALWQLAERNANGK